MLDWPALEIQSFTLIKQLLTLQTTLKLKLKTAELEAVAV